MESLGEGWISSGIAVLAEWEGAVIPSCSASLTDVRPQCVDRVKRDMKNMPFDVKEYLEYNVSGSDSVGDWGQ